MTKREHLLVCLAEECTEVAQACAKALRFGLEDSYPGYCDGKTNREAIVAELHDVLAIIDLLEDDDILIMPADRDAIESKKAKVRKFMGRARTTGALQ